MSVASRSLSTEEGTDAVGSSAPVFRLQQVHCAVVAASGKAVRRRIGVHTSIAGGVHEALARAHALQCTTVQIFSHNPRGWSVKPITPDHADLFRKSRKSTGISPVFVHTSYLINLASLNSDLLGKSEAMVLEELRIADALGVEYVVLHTGSASADDPGRARQRAIGALRRIAGKGPFKSRLLLENTAGERGDITSSFADLAEIVHAVPEGLIGGICVDTCHAFASGYDFRDASGLARVLDEVNRHLGSQSIKLIHLNDAKHPLGSGRDRHEHIGKGMIGLDGMQMILRHPAFKDVPFVLETPKKSDDDDRMNLATVASLLA